MLGGACDTFIIMKIVIFFPSAANYGVVKIILTTGMGMEIEWKDGHWFDLDVSVLRDAVLAHSAMRNGRDGRKPGEG